MSYIPFRMGCDDCHAEWNCSVGMVGMTSMAAGNTEECPKCHSKNIKSVGSGWRMSDGSLFPAQQGVSSELTEEQKEDIADAYLNEAKHIWPHEFGGES